MILSIEGDRFRGNADPVSMNLDRVRNNLRSRDADGLGRILDKAYETDDILWERSNTALSIGKAKRVRLNQGSANARHVISMVYEELRERSQRTELIRR